MKMIERANRGENFSPPLLDDNEEIRFYQPLLPVLLC